MNSFIRMEITTQIVGCKNFITSCKRDALKDDGVVDKEEKKQIKRLEKMTQKYIKGLERIAKTSR